MKLVLHIVKKDLRRLRSWLLLWLGVLILPIMLAVTVAQRGKDWADVADINPWLLVLQALVAYLLAVLVVQEDPVVGTRQFWATRPIGGGRLLAAKGVTALTILWGGTLAVGLPWWWWCGWGVTEMTRAALEYGFLTFAVATPALIIGALTGTLSRALLWSPPVLLAFFMWVMPLVVGSSSLQNAMGGLFRTAMAVIATWLLLWVALVGLYRSWWRRKSFLAWGVASLVLWLVSARLPVETLLASGPKEMRPEAGAAIRLEPGEAKVQILRQRNRSIEQQANVWVEFVGAKDGFAENGQLFINGLGADGTWRWDGQSLQRFGTVSRWSRGYWILPGYTLPKADPETQAWREEEARKYWAVRPGRQRVSSRYPSLQPTDTPLFQSMFHVPASFADKMTKEPAKFEAKLWLALARPTLRTELPVQSGLSQRGDTQRVFLRQAGWLSDGPNQRARIVLAEYVPQSWAAMLLQTATEQSTTIRTRTEGGYLMLNRETKELIPASSSDRVRMAYIHGAAVSVRAMSFVVDRLRRGDTFVDRPGWDTQTSLVFSQMKVESIFTRDVKVDGFTARNIAVDAPAKK